MKIYVVLDADNQAVGTFCSSQEAQKFISEHERLYYVTVDLQIASIVDEGE